MKFLAMFLVLILVRHGRHSASQLWVWDLELENFCFIFLQARTLTRVNECTTNIEAFNKSKVTTFCRSKEHIVLISCWRHRWSGFYAHQLDLAVGNSTAILSSLTFAHWSIYCDRVL
jgi:hypothetical protein